MVLQNKGGSNMLNLDDTSFDYADRITQTLRYAKPMTARALFELIFVFYPKPAAWLLNLRDQLVKPLGLRTGNHFEQLVLSETGRKIVLGQKDKHLDFYVVLECLAPMGSWQDIHVSTYVTYHNFLGKLYFGGIRIFHVFLVKSLLNRAARLWMKNHSNTHV